MNRTKLAVAIAAVLLCTGAHATNNHSQGPKQDQDQDQDQGQLQAQGQLQGQLQGQTSSNRNSNTNTSSNRNSNSNTNTSRANASAVSEGSVSSSESTGGAASAEQSQTQTASADNAGNTQSLTVNEAALPTRTLAEVRSVPTAIAPNIYPTASCAMSASVGASAMGWGVSGGGSKVNQECVMLETARVFSQLGFQTQGLDVLCSTETSLRVFGTRDACIRAGSISQAAPEPTVVVLAPPAPYMVERRPYVSGEVK